MLHRIYIIRHGAPQQNTGLAYETLPGPPLSEIGIAEASAAGIFLKARAALDGDPIERFFASPFDRTRGTANAISQQTGLPVLVDDALAEMGKDEPFEGVRRRIRGWLAARLAGDQTCIAFVSHGSPIKAALQLLSEDKLDLSKYVFPVGNPSPTAGIWRATRTGEGWLCELIFQPQAQVQS
jgi:broad specificity phosphatase PhoE